jgi:type II secretory pathway component HofQ
MYRFLLILILIPVFAFPYTVVRKDGRPFSGDIVKQDRDFVVIRDIRGIEVKFRVDQLDMARTDAANSGKPQTQTATNQTTGIKRNVETQWTGEPISVDFKDIDIKDFFRFIAEISGMNMILDPSVKGTLTIKLTEVPWDQALDVVCRTNGLGYEIDGNVMSVK